MKKNTTGIILPGFDTTDEEEEQDDEIQDDEEMIVAPDDWGTLNDDQLNNFEQES